MISGGKLLGQITKGEWEVTSLNAVRNPRAPGVFHGDGEVISRASPVSHWSRWHQICTHHKEEGTHDAVLAPNAATFYRHLLEYRSSATPGPLSHGWLTHRADQ